MGNNQSQPHSLIYLHNITQKSIHIKCERCQKHFSSFTPSFSATHDIPKDKLYPYDSKDATYCEGNGNPKCKRHGINRRHEILDLNVYYKCIPREYQGIQEFT